MKFGKLQNIDQVDFSLLPDPAGNEKVLQALEAQPEPPRLLSLSSLAAREPGLSHYAASKRAGEQVLLEEAERVQWMALRPPVPSDQETVIVRIEYWAPPGTSTMCRSAVSSA